jgi:hypothetical protein
MASLEKLEEKLDKIEDQNVERHICVLKKLDTVGQRTSKLEGKYTVLFWAVGLLAAGIASYVVGIVS